MVSERRRNSRVKVDSLLPVDLGRENGGIVLNLSEGGLRVRMVGRLETDDIIRLRFTLPEQNNRIETLGQIAWVDEARTGGGVRLVSLAEESQQQIKHWLALNAPASETQPQETLIQTKATAREPVESLPEQAEVTGSAATPLEPKKDSAVASEFQPLLTESATVREFRLKRQQSHEQAMREEFRHRLIRAGISACLLIVVVVAGAALYRFQGERIKGFLGAIKEQLVASGAWPSEAGRPTTTATREDKSAPPAPQRGASKIQPGAEHEPPILSANARQSMAEALSKKPGPPELVVLEANGQRRLIAYRGGPVAQLKNWPRGRVEILRDILMPGAASSSEPVPVATANARTAGSAQEATDGVAEQQQLPAYPPLALQNNVQGTVVLRAVIGKDGVVQNVQLVSGPPVLASAVLDAVRKWRYMPYLRNGEPVEVERQITVEFTISPK